MITVIADDLTGAAEIAGVCLRYDLTVSLGIDSVPDADTDVRVISTDSRSASETEAKTLHSNLSTEIFKNRNSWVFKKCDSVLRGYVLTELSATLEASHKRKILIQPSNPETRRCIKDGIYYVGEQKIENTGFASDPDFPATESQVQNLLLHRSTSHENISNIHIGKIKKLDGDGVFVPDCLSIDDLYKSCTLADEETLLCGSAAFFEQILIHNNYKVKTTTNLEFKATEFLLVGGSTHPESRILQQRLKDEGCELRYFPNELLTEQEDCKTLKEFGLELAVAWNKNKKLIISISKEKIQFPNSSLILKNRLSVLIEFLLNSCSINEVFIEGGATTYDILKQLKATTLTPMSEISPGIVRLKVNNFKNLHITIKPGSYLWTKFMF
jgi:D-threonate/D-erythronate kinase